ncbi:LPS-assembly protein LptD [Ramlibacter sp. MAHUQ-53]|uniref:LPS-assembly protein LptD n=1 Tax=unclassified Ramlibacter TaxID=2617605 RepID=UPI00362D960D
MQPFSHPVRRARFALTPVALVAAGLLHGAPAGAQAPDAAALRPSPQLREQLPPEQRRQLPTFVEGDRITGRTELDTVIEGNAVLRRGDMVLRADRIEYHQPEDLAKAQGRVRVNRAGDVYEGTQAEIKVDAFQGFFTDPSYRFLRNGAYGRASRIDFLDDQHAIIRQASYTTCRREPGDSGAPAWMLTADQIAIDDEEETGLAHGARLRFFGVPILPFPAMSFPLSDKRKSGFLPPTLAMDNVSGTMVSAPYYWNIAPNRDLTVAPTVLTQRGLNLGGEFRYLEPDHRGTLRASMLPGDPLRDQDRWSYSLRHNDRLTRTPLPGGMGLNLELNRVSDDNYWRDFTRGTSFFTGTTSLTQRLLANDGSFTWGQGAWSLQARALKWQTLQDVSAPIVPPYDRLPQLVGRWRERNLPGGLTGYVEADFTEFRSVRELTLQPNAQRSFVMAQLARPWQAPGWFVVPRLQLHARQYRFDAPLGSTATAPGAGAESAQVTVPTYSLSSGLVFERDTRLFGRALVQTLEPRAFYVYTPFRSQNHLPNYDSAATDFNFATIFSENTFGGHDRIADNNLLTLGAISRLQDPGTGAELARFGLAQRLRFEDQRVVLPGGTPATDRLSDLLIGGSLNWVPAWTTDMTAQYNPKTSRSERVTLGARYNPTPYRLVNAAYRLQRGQSEQLDIGWQWPINDLWGDRGLDLGPGRGQGGGRWYGVGRLNMSLKERKLVDAIAGIEYDGCCWIGRVVLERLQTGRPTANTRILFQLEFVGFSRLGTNATGVLKDNIPRYQFLRDQVAAPSRFTNYD